MAGDGYAYSAMAAATVDPTVPDDWPDGWDIPNDPLDPWPPGWPVTVIPGSGGNPALYTLVADAPTSIAPEEGATIVAYALDELGGNADDLLLHVIRVSATNGATTVQTKKAVGGTFANFTYFQMSNYTGSRYGISQSVIFDVAEGDEGDTITVLVEIVSTSPDIEDSDTTVVEAGVDYAVAATVGNITLSGPQTIDGVAVIADDRVLVWKQTSATANGTYTVAAGAWTLLKSIDSTGLLYKPVFVAKGNAFGQSMFFGTAVDTMTWQRDFVRVAMALPDTHALSGTTAIEGVTIAAGDLVLAAFQSTASQNGVYVVASGSWVKVLSFNAADVGLEIAVGNGTVFGQTTFYVTAANTASWQKWNIPVVAATLANHALSGTTAIDGVTLTSGNLVLCWYQTTASENGVYSCNSSTWKKVKSFAAADVGTIISVGGGTVFGQTAFFVSAANTASWKRESHWALVAAVGDHGLSGTTSISSVTITAGSVVLCAFQATASQNGLYLVTAAGTWTKVFSFAAGDVGKTIAVSQGVFAQSQFVVTAANTAKWRRTGYGAICASTADHGLTGTSTVDGVSISQDSLVLVWKQTSAAANGLYLVQGSGTWTKLVSFAAGDGGTQVGVGGGTLYGKLNFVVSAANTLVAGGAVLL